MTLSVVCAAVLLAVACGGSGSAVRSGAPGTIRPRVAEVARCDVEFLNTEFLSNPTGEGVTVSLIPTEQAELYVEYGSRRSRYSRSTPPQSVSPENLAAFTLDGLKPDGEYFYRVRCRRPGQGGFGAREPRRFRTLREPGATFSFGFATDSHIYQGYANAGLTRDPSERPAPVFYQTLENLQREDVDFLILGGDEAMLVCSRCPALEVDGEYAGSQTARSPREALLRYRIFRRAYEQAAHSVPVHLTLGNHDGEAGFGDPDGWCQHYDVTRAFGQFARLQHLPNPDDVYSGSPEGNYYAFESGDALFVILDVMRYTMDYPDKPEAWTLGEEQLAWLERTLEASSKSWKFLFAHHLVGGAEYGACYTYGRGGLKSTDTGEITGAFRGEQSDVHDLMRRHGAQVFFLGHDHIFQAGEKLDRQGRAEGIHYVVGGRPTGGSPPPWASRPDFRELYDYDGDGAPEYLFDKGFLKVTVHGTDGLRLEYIKSDIVDPEQNGKVVYDKWISDRSVASDRKKKR